MSKVILASQSPRRRELLSLHGIDYEAVVSKVDEKAIEALFDGQPSELVRKLAEAKAEEVFARTGTDKPIIAADTVVEIDSQVLEKPKSEQEAAEMLRHLSGRTHAVHTGVAVIVGGRKETFTETASVTFRELTDREIAHYVASGQPMDKAGAYGIQGIASKFISSINGDYFTVVGLPLCRLSTLLRDKFGIDFTDLSV